METTNNQTQNSPQPSQTKTRFSAPTRESFIQEPADFVQKLPATGIHTIEVNLLGGNLVVVGDSENEISITMQWDKQNSQLLPKVEQKGSVLFIHSQALRPFLGQKNPYIVELHVPRSTRIKAKLSFGTCYFENLDDFTEAYVTFGDVQGFLKNAKVEVTAGDIKLHGLSGDIDARVDAGDIELVWEHIPSSTKAKAFCGVGDIALQFPEGMNPKANTIRNILKKCTIENQAQASIQATVGIGDIQIS